MVVTKTEKRTTTQHASDAIQDGIEDINGIKNFHMPKEEREFFKHLVENKKAILFPLPDEPYNVGERFQNDELKSSILNHIKNIRSVKVGKEDFKSEVKIDTSSSGNIMTDFNTAKSQLIETTSSKLKSLKDGTKGFIEQFPKDFYNIENIRKIKSVWENYAKNVGNICNSPQNSSESTPKSKESFEELISLYCELDNSISFLQKYTTNGKEVLKVDDVRNKLLEVINEVRARYEWTSCTTNLYKTFFQFLINQNTSDNPKNIGTIFDQNIKGSHLFRNNDQVTAVKAMIEYCTPKNEERRQLEDLRIVSEENNALDKLAKFVISIMKKSTLQYSDCTIKGFAPAISSIPFNNDALLKCEEIAIYGVYSIKIDNEVKLPGKNLVMIAPEISVINNQKITLDGKNGEKPPEVFQGTSADGSAGDAGESSGSFFGYCSSMNSIDYGKLVISANGGRGGDGQDGSKGKSGDKGEPAQLTHLENAKMYAKGDAISYNNVGDTENWEWKVEIRCSQHGGEGKIGKNGGTGGEGGKGGLAGTITDVQENKKGINILHKISEIGENGNNGKPGEGGDGGEHGNDLCQVIAYPLPYVWNVAARAYYTLPKPKPLKTVPAEYPTEEEPNIPPQVTFKNPKLITLSYPLLAKQDNAASGNKGSKGPVNKSKDPVVKKAIHAEEKKQEFVKFVSTIGNIQNLVNKAEDEYNDGTFSEMLDFFDNLKQQEISVEIPVDYSNEWLT